MTTKDYSLGIDYYADQANIDPETGIRYGVIPQTEILRAWTGESEAQYPCDDCACKPGSDDCSFGGCEPSGYVYIGNGIAAESGSDGDIFVTKSPYYTRCQLCSPCASGAGYLVNSRDGGVKAYCFGHDWFWNWDLSGGAPYPVYRVSDDTRVEPECECAE